jgi:hypothetical protein
LVIIDTMGIQDYIFSSNRLRENLGASQLAYLAVEDWLFAALPTPHNLAKDEDGQLTIIESAQIEKDRNLRAELLLRGGGNATILFRNKEDARDEDEAREPARAAVSALSQKLLAEAPGLTIVAALQPFTWDTGLGAAIQQLTQNLDAAKQRRAAGAPALGQGVTLECRSTGMPAVGYAPPQGADDDGTRPISADVLARLDGAVQGGARKRFEDLLPADVRARYAIPERFDDLGRSAGVQSYLAVVHADGNGIGQRFDDLIRKPLPARDMIEQLRALSAGVDRANIRALQTMIKELTDAFATEKQRDREDPLVLFLAGLPKCTDGKDKGKPFLPLRPIVYGGDDVTFVCDGRLGLALAASYLRHFHEATQDVQLPGGPAHACAGVVIVKTHYPFARAYGLAEQLCKSAKRALRKAERTNESAIDWHFALSGLLADLKTIREREYTADTGAPLVARPLTIFGPGLDTPRLRPHQDERIATPWRCWKYFTAAITEFQSGKDWRGRRNKVKELREVLRRGSNEVERFRRAFVLEDLPALPGAGKAMQRTGWDDDACGYFDAIEALDFYLNITDSLRR